MTQVDPISIPFDFFSGLDLLSRNARLGSFQERALRTRSQLSSVKQKRWESEIPWPSKQAFKDRLAAVGLTVERFRDVLNTPHHVLANTGTAPEWMTVVEQCFNTDKPLLELPMPEHLELHPLRPFLRLAMPLLENAVHTLRQTLESEAFHSRWPLTNRVELDRVLSALIPQLAGKILNMISRTMVLELHVSKMRGTLSGATSEERFADFSNQFLSRKRSYTLLREYPVLAHQLVLTANNWTAFTSGFLKHLLKDFDEITETFFQGQSPGPLISCDMGVGDGHRGGKSVILLTFQSGQRLVYKPRSLSIDTHFYQLLQWLNQKGDHPSFSILKVMDKGSYGWMPFIQPASCRTKAQLANFYFRQGGYLALLYALEAVDFHYENIIAQGEHPFLIDLESLFQPRIEMNTNKEELALTQKIAFSVLRVGLLPVSVYSENAKGEADFSGLGSSAGQVSPRKQPTWEKTGTDEIRMVKKNLAMGAGLNRPKLNGEPVEVLDYADSILHGFQSIYQTIIKHRDEFLSAKGPLHAFANDEVRVIFRPTRVYATLHQESFHPDVLRDGLDRDLLFDQLWQSTQEQPFLSKLIPQELTDLRNGDIPLFTARAGGNSIRNGFGTALGFEVDRSGIQGAISRIEQMDENDFERQSWFVKASLSTLAMSAELTKMASYPFRISQELSNSLELIDAAKQIGDRICRLAIHNGSEVAWIGMSITPDLKWVISPLAENIYAGRAGIVLFLAHLERLTGDEKYGLLARKAFLSLKKQLDRRSHEFFAIGAFSGWGGMLYLMVELGNLWNQPDLIEEAKTYVPEMMDYLKKDQYFDVLYGAAGGIVSLLALYQASPDPELLMHARACGDYLLANQTPADGGTKAWVVPVAGAKPLAGFSHGAAGTAWALYKLAEVSGDSRYAQAANQAIRYERQIFCADFGNWPDLRTMGTQRPTRHRDGLRFMNAWCHGASGVALGRLDTPHIFHDSEYANEIEVAIETTRRNGFGGSHCLCHGDLGNLEMMHLASLRKKDPALREEVMRRAKAIVSSFGEHGHLCGIPLGVETPGMMNGLAGIGYQLMRLANPDQVPSILILETSKSLGPS